MYRDSHYYSTLNETRSWGSTYLMTYFLNELKSGGHGGEEGGQGWDMGKDWVKLLTKGKKSQGSSWAQNL